MKVSDLTEAAQFAQIIMQDETPDGWTLISLSHEDWFYCAQLLNESDKPGLRMDIRWVMRELGRVDECVAVQYCRVYMSGIEVFPTVGGWS